MKTILIYGDSLAWGLIPGSKFERFPKNVRWPGRLQELLGEDYDIIEENLCARTIQSDDPRPGFEGRNGMSYLAPCLDSHDPIDLLILALGLNEVKSLFTWTPDEVGKMIGEMIDIIKSRKPNFHERNTKILLLAPPVVIEDTGYWGDIWKGSAAKSKELGKVFESVAKEKECYFFDLSKICKTGIDGVHLDEEAHEAVAQAILGNVIDIISDINSK